MTTPGEEIRQARKARGWSTVELARRSGVGDRTIRRIESGDAKQDFSRTLPRVQRALGLGDWPDIVDEGPPLRQASMGEIAAEILRRAAETAQLLDHYRIRAGELPDGILNRPGVIAGPRPDEPETPAQSAT